ncbi:stalk domain-containing protein [Tissierella sp. Yu-01]|uniref:stalk domain-containing protein n=1 Tax=Tissierella sp. Yu-01 TaxID=3035694 RepID=UPI00240E2E27|nr:stalk domain-containing protein [Tissierella sp. Yu-01]WFA08012.1 stalk domain-containing protein [Tissierella sp. Yu-01]
MKTRLWQKILLLTLVIMVFIGLPAHAAQTETISLKDADSGYKIVVPGFIDVREVEVDGEIITAVIAEKPAKESSGRYKFFEIITTNEDASMIVSYPGTTEYEQIGDYASDIENGKVTYSPTLYDDFEELVADSVFCFDFSVYNEDNEMIDNFIKIYFVFESVEESTVPTETPVPTPVETSDTVQVEEKTAKPTGSKVLVDGADVSFEAYNIDGNNYFKLRDLAMAVTGTDKQFEVTWDGEKNAINLVSGEAYTAVGGEFAVSSGTESVKAVTTQSKIYVDGEEIALQAYTIGGNNYFKLRDIGEVFDFGITWDGALNQIVIDTSIGYVAE